MIRNKKLVWHRKKIAVSYVEDGKRKRRSLGTTDLAVAKSMLRRIGDKRPTKRLGEFIYFFQIDTPDKFIKIGFATNVAIRLSNVRVSSPYPIEVLAVIPGSEIFEAEIHQKFAAQRVQGEWFRPTPEILAFIETLKDTVLSAKKETLTHDVECAA